MTSVSTVPAGSLAKAALVGAKTVNGPGAGQRLDQPGRLHRGDQRRVVLRVDRVLDDGLVGIHRRAADHHRIARKGRAEARCRQRTRRAISSSRVSILVMCEAPVVPPIGEREQLRSAAARFSRADHNAARRAHWRSAAIAGAHGCLTPAAPIPKCARPPAPPGGFGAVAQLGERRVRNAEVRGSIPLGSTIPDSTCM